MKPYRLKKVTFTYEILMPEDEAFDGDLETVQYQCGDGGWSGLMGDAKEEIVEGQEACQLECDRQGSAFEFFFDPDDEDYHDAECKFCETTFRSEDNNGHRHDGGWVCDDCWDERLRSTE